MTEEEIVSIANTYLYSQIKPDSPYAYKFTKIYHNNPSLCSVVYNILIKDSPGAVVDGPEVILVDLITKEARFLMSL